MSYKEFFDETKGWFVVLSDDKNCPRAVSIEHLFQKFEQRQEAERAAPQGKQITWGDMQKFFHEQYARKTR